METTEKQIISALMFGDLDDAIYSFLPADAFTNFGCREIYKILLAEHNNGELHDAETIAAKLENDTRTRRDAYILIRESTEASEMTFSAKTAAKTLYNSYLAREASEIISKASFRANNISEERDRVIEELSKLKMPTEEYVTADELVQNNENNLLAMRQNYIDICFENLQDMVRFDAGNLFVLGARPATGKSAFALQVLVNIALQGKRVLFFNLEMPEEEIYERLIANISGLTLQRIRRHIKFNEEEIEQIKTAGEKLKELKKNLIVSTKCRTLSDICNLTRKLKPDIICVDYLQKVINEHKSDSRAREVGEISQRLKDLAIELNIPIFAIVQLNRQSDPYKEPSMNEIKESGDIEQDASVIMMLWRTDKEDDRKRGLRIDKNRQGATGRVDLVFKGEFMKFSDGSDFEPALDDIPTIFKDGL